MEFDFESNRVPKSYILTSYILQPWQVHLAMLLLLLLLLLNLTGGWRMFGESDLREKITSFTCLLGSGLNCIFH